MGLTTKEISSSSFNDMISSVDRRSEYVENRAGANVRLNNFLTPYTLDDKSSILNAPCGYSNGVYPSLRPVQTIGPELVTNGNYSNGTTSWDATRGATLTASNNVLTVASNSTAYGGAARQVVTVVVGKKYKWEFTINEANDTRVGIRSGTADFATGAVILDINDLGVGTYTYTFTATATSVSVILGTMTLSGQEKYSNVSVKEVTDADFDFTRGSAATRVTKDGLIKNVQILSDDLVQNGNFEEIGPEEVTNGDFSQIGSELVTNGDFDTDSNWTKGTGWSISGGKAICDGTQVSNSIFYQNIGNQGNKTVQFSFTISDYVSGVLETAFFGASGTIAETISANGNYTFYISVKSGHNGNTGFIAKVGFIGSIDNVSVKEVGQDWTFGTGWSMGDGKAVRVASSSTDLVQAGAFPNLTSIFKITFDVVRSAGAVRLRAGTLNLPYVNATDTYTYYVTPTSNDQIKFQADSSFEGSIDNISVKEVGQNWLFQNGWNMGDGVAVYSGTVSAYRTIYQEDVLTVSSKYRLTFDIVSISSGSIENVSQSSPTSYNTIGTKTEEFIATNTDLFLKPTTDADLTIDNVSVIEITDDTDLPRIDYTNGTGSLLLEPQSTNKVTYSEQFDNAAWDANSDVLLESGYAAPDGSNNAYKVTKNGGNSKVALFLGGIPPFTKSIYARTISGTGTAFFGEGSTTGSGVLSTVTTQWQRFEITVNDNNFYGVDFRGGSTLTEVLIWGAQLEEQSYATSYIPTSGSTVTRNADVCDNAGSSDLINSTEGVLYAEIAALANDGTYREISLNDGTINNAVEIRYTNTDNLFQFVVRDGGAVSVNSVFTLTNVLEFNKIALSYKADDYKMYINGIEVAADTSGTTPSGLNRLSFNWGGSNPFYGNVRSVAVFKEALTDEELVKITSTTQQEVFYEMRDKMLQINADYYEFGDYTTRLKKLF